MFRLSLILLAVLAVTLASVPFGNAYTATRGNIQQFTGGGACMPTGCPPISMGAYPAPGPMPGKITKCKVPQMCAPMPCPPPMCGPAPCAPACTTWY
jgi:hypothetical protein